MAKGFVIRKNQYFDSVFLMSVNKHLSDEKGVEQTAVLMGSDGNKKLLTELGFDNPQIQSAQPNDLIVTLVAGTEESVQNALGKLDGFLQGGTTAETNNLVFTFEDGLKVLPRANLVVISVPGEYAAEEARKALTKGLHVFLFSDNVSLEDELAIKTLAKEEGLLVMGPDCGTSILHGIGIGFANFVRRGSVGVVGSSGTGIQEFTCGIHHTGCGISHAIGTGSHDLSDKIGGITTFQALDALEEDPQTKVIAIISKPPGTRTLQKMIERFATYMKPIIGCFLGIERNLLGKGSIMQQACTIDEAVRLTVQALAPGKAKNSFESRTFYKQIQQAKAARNSQQRYLRGIFAGGTFCYQSQQILREKGVVVYSNTPFDKEWLLDNPTRSFKNSIVDMGDDYFMQGKPHPMINGLERKKRILQEAKDPNMAVLLLDFILGYNSSADPVGEVIDGIVEAMEQAKQRGGYLSVVASICGTEGDPQDLIMQTKMLEEAGVMVFRSNEEATRMCLELLQ